MDEQEDDLPEVSWLDVFEESGYWVEPIAPHLVKYLEVDASYMMICHSDPSVPENDMDKIAVIGVVCFFQGGLLYGRIDAYGHTNLARLDRVQRRVFREFKLLFQVRLNTRAALSNFCL